MMTFKRRHESISISCSVRGFSLVAGNKYKSTVGGSTPALSATVTHILILYGAVVDGPLVVITSSHMHIKCHVFNVLLLV